MSFLIENTNVNKNLIPYAIIPVLIDENMREDEQAPLCLQC